MNSDILTTLEAAHYVRLGKPTLERARVTGEGPRYAKLGGSVRYRRADLDDWLASRLVASTSAKNPSQPPLFNSAARDHVPPNTKKSHKPAKFYDSLPTTGGQS